jgi:hypothetical protein
MLNRKPPVSKQPAADALDDMACAEAFAKQREKPRWVTVATVVVTLIVVCSLILTFLNRSAQVPGFITLGGVLLLLGFSPWLSISAACPRCKQNVTTCPTVHCHRCRQPLLKDRCQTCNTDVAWGDSNATLPIRYCPGCGACVNSDLRRYTYTPD